jgi:hypothetical protein
MQHDNYQYDEGFSAGLAARRDEVRYCNRDKAIVLRDHIAIYIKYARFVKTSDAEILDGVVKLLEMEK